MVISTKPILLSTEEAAEYIGVQPQTLALWRSTGRYRIPYLKIGRLVRYRQSDLDVWLSSREATHTSEIA
jgi:excisionase family DNA binding protein